MLYGNRLEGGQPSGEEDQLLCYCSNSEKYWLLAWKGGKAESINQFQNVQEIETIEPGN